MNKRQMIKRFLRLCRYYYFIKNHGIKRPSLKGMKQYICWSHDEENLKRCASGGIMFEIAKVILRHGGSIVGINEDFEWELTTDLERVKHFSGSKYTLIPIPSALLKKIRSYNGLVCFVGTPCQVEFIRNHRRKNIIFVNLFCHGFPESNHRTDERYIRNGCHKEHGWSHSCEHMDKDYLDNNNLMNKCKKCNMHQSRNGDLTISDAWNCPDYQKNEMGTSRVYTNTLFGFELFNMLDIEKQKEGHIGKKDKIAVYDIHDHDNFGNLMLLINTMMYLGNKDVRWVMLTDRPLELKKKLQEMNIMTSNCEFRKPNLINRHLGFCIRNGFLYHAIVDCKSLIILGGDSFTCNHWLSKWYKSLMGFHECQRMNIDTYFLSNNFDTFPLHLKPLIKRIFGKFEHFYVRDMHSVFSLQSIGVKMSNISVIGDLAIMDLPSQKMVQRKDKCILCPSYLWWKYAVSYDDYLLHLHDIFENLKRFNLAKPYMMVHSSDKRAYNIIDEYMKRYGKVDILVPTNPIEARYFLQTSLLNICFRMHSCISSLQGFVPTFCIGYSKKYKSIIGYQMGQKDWLMDMKSCSKLLSLSYLPIFDKKELKNNIIGLKAWNRSHFSTIRKKVIK